MRPLLLAYVENNHTDIAHLEAVLSKAVVNPIRVFTSGEALIDYLFDSRDNPPGVVLVDLSPGTDGVSGLGTVRIIREAMPELGDMPIVVLTGQEITRELKRQVKNAGANGIVQKPFTLDTLYSLLGLPGWYRVAVLEGRA